LAVFRKGDIMAWGIAIGVYLAAGLATFVWLNLSRAGQGLGRNKRGTLLVLILPEVCLLWPFIVFVSLRRGRSGQSVRSNDEVLQ